MNEHPARKFLNMVIPDEVRENLNREYGLALKPGATYKAAMDLRAEELARRSPAWAALYEEYHGQQVMPHE